MVFVAISARMMFNFFYSQLYVHFNVKLKTVKYHSMQCKCSSNIK